MPDNVSQIPAARVPIWDKVTNFVTREWYRWFYNVYVLLGSGSLRYGAFYDTTDQTAAAINTAYPITFNNTDLTAGVYVDPTVTSRIYVDRVGSYNFQFSAQFVSNTASTKLIYVWPRINGVDVSNSATKITMKGNAEAYVAAWNFVIRMNVGDYFQLMWATDNTDVQINADAATAFCPAVPSVILTVSCNVGE